MTTITVTQITSHKNQNCTFSDIYATVYAETQRRLKMNVWQFLFTVSLKGLWDETQNGGFDDIKVRFTCGDLYNTFDNHSCNYRL